MNPAETKRFLKIVDESLSLAPEDRESFITQACAGDERLKQQILENIGICETIASHASSSDSQGMPEIPVNMDFESRYEIKGEIAQGGMGRVLMAHDRKLDRPVAVKVLLGRFAHTPGMVRRFLNEAQISGRLIHPGIPPIHEIGSMHNGEVFIAMKLVHGKTFKTLLKKSNRTPTSIADSIEIFESVCQAVAFAHSKNIVHRDLKPDNIMVGEFGEIQVMDWGLAKRLSDPLDFDIHTESADPPDAALAQTRVGSAIGTPAYMPPEQTIGLSQLQTDVFALGGLLCEIITGDPPYRGSSSTMQLQEASKANLDLVYERLRCSDTDPALVDLAIECLNPDPQKRPENAGVVAKRVTDYIRSVSERLRLGEIAREKAVAVAAEHRRSTRFKLTAVIVAFGLVTAVLAGVIYSSQQSAAHALQIMTVEQQEAKKQESIVYREVMRSAYREYNYGNHAEVDRLLGEAPDLLQGWEWHYLRNTLDVWDWRLELPGTEIHFATFLEGQPHLCLVDKVNKVRFVDVESQAIVQEVDGPVGVPLASSANGRFVLSCAIPKTTPGSELAKVQHLMLWETETGAVVQEFEMFPKALNTIRLNHFAISRDGRFVACVSKDAFESVSLYQTGHEKPILTAEAGASGVTFSPSGDWFVYLDAKAATVRFWDPAEGKEARSPIQSGGRRLRISSDHTKLAIVRHDGIQIWDLESNEVLHLEMKPVKFYDVSAVFSPDGKEFISTVAGDAINVWSCETGKILRKVGINPSWGPIGLSVGSFRKGRIAYSSSNSERSEIRLTPLKTQSPRLLSGHTSFVYPVAITADGKRIVSGAWDNALRIWDGDTGDVLAVCEGHSSYVSDLTLIETLDRVISVDGEGHVRLWDLTTGNLVATRSVPASSTPSPHSKFVANADNGKTVFATTGSHLVRMDANTLATLQHIDISEIIQGEELHHFDVSPSGKYLAVAGFTRSRNLQMTEIGIISLQSLDSVYTSQSEFEFNHRAFRVRFSPDESLIAVGYADGSIDIRSLSTPDIPLWSNAHHQGEIFDLQFLPDGQRLFSAGRDGTIRIWDANDGTLLGVLEGHENYVFSLDLSDNAERLVSGSGDHTVRVWEAPSFGSRNIVPR